MQMQTTPIPVRSNYTSHTNDNPRIIVPSWRPFRGPWPRRPQPGPGWRQYDPPSCFSGLRLTARRTVPSLEGQGTVPAILSVRISRRGIAWPRWPMQGRHPSRRRHARPPPSHPARRTVPTPPLSAPALCQNQADVPDFVSINRTPLLRPCIATDGPRSDRGRRARAQRIIQRWRSERLLDPCDSLDKTICMRIAESWRLQ